MTGALSGIKVLDLSRILAGPTCTQILGDMGAQVLKVENPRTGGDETRMWGPPFIEGAQGEDSDLSSYFICANRNKKSVSIDLSSKDGQSFIRELALQADIVVENFKPGGLVKYGLDAKALLSLNSGLIYASISGFGQTGPNRDKPGYDIMAQGFSGFMSLTGEPEGMPMKAPVGIADVMCGMYTCIGVLAALHHRNNTGEGQHIDVALMDAQIAGMINEGTNYLTTQKLPIRRGNTHPNIAPYQVFKARDGHVILAVGNDSQFERFCVYAGLDRLISDPKFATNPQRLKHREELAQIIEPVLSQRKAARIIGDLEAIKVPVGPVQNLEQVFSGDHVAARDMRIKMNSNEDSTQTMELIGNPIKFSQTPISYRYPPPRFGEHTQEIVENAFKTPDLTEN